MPRPDWRAPPEDEMQHYMALRLDEQDSAMQDIVREVHLIQENQRVSTITGANFAVPKAAGEVFGRASHISEMSPLNPPMSPLCGKRC